MHGQQHQRHVAHPDGHLGRVTGRAQQLVQLGTGEPDTPVAGGGHVLRAQLGRDGHRVLDPPPHLPGLGQRTVPGPLMLGRRS